MPRTRSEHHASSRDVKMSLGDHLRELRRRLFFSAVALIAGMVIGWMLTPYVWDALRAPIFQIAQDQGRAASINYTDIAGAFNLKLQISFTISAIITCPFWLYQIWAFLFPGLTRRERRWSIAFLASAVPLFLAGCAAGWLVFPNIVRLMTSFAPREDSQIVNADIYFQFVIRLMLTIGVAFVLPVFLVVLNFAGILSARSILRSWRWALLVIILFTAAATPSADVVSMFLLAAPMVVLYLAAAMIAVVHDRREAKRTKTVEADIASEE